MKKIKVTYSDYGITKAKIINCSSLYNIGSDCAAHGIYYEHIIKIEVIMEAEPHNIIDVSN